MDKKAKELVQIQMHESVSRACLTFLSQRISLHLAGTPIVGDLQYQVQQHKYGHQLESRLQKNLQ